jgi:hypothetical protein
MIDILRFDQGFEVIFKNFGEIVLKLGPAEIFENFLPIWGIIVLSKVWFQLSREDFESGRFPYTVGTD